MTSFIHYINRARLSLMPRPAESNGLSMEKIRVNEVDRQLSNFNKEFSVHYSDLEMKSQTSVQSIFNDSMFQNDYLNTEEKTDLLLHSFDQHFAGFSPLHPAYPLINSFNDCQTNLGKINSDTLEIQEKILKEIISILEK